jgi:hypothetical protein
MPGVCYAAFLLLETSGRSDNLVDEKRARKYTLSVVCMPLEERHCNNLKLMIRIFTQYLPYRLSDQMIIEYDRRLADIKHFISGKYDYYTPLRDDIETIQMLLALSIFHKRVLSNFESATKFTSRVVLNSQADSVQIGTYDLSSKEIFKLNKTVITFRKLMQDYTIPLNLFEYLETKEFLKKVKIYRDSFQFDSKDGKSI